MSDTFLDRLRSNRLTNVEQYRRMKKEAGDRVVQSAEGNNDEWKGWQLAPVSSGVQGEVKEVRSSKSAEHLQRALRKVT